MSKMIPQETVDTMRHAVDVSVDNYGIDCVLYVPTNVTVIETVDMYSKPSDYTFDEYNTQVWIDWSPDKHRLRKLGLFVEDDIPMLAWFQNKISGENIDITLLSWFKISTQYIPDEIDTDEFEIVDVVLPGMHDKVITKFFKIAPRRVKNV